MLGQVLYSFSMVEKFTFWHSGKWWVTALHVESSITGVTEKHIILQYNIVETE